MKDNVKIMQIKKILVAGALGALMAGSTVAFAATSLSDYPKPFVDGASVNTLVVVGAAAQPGDVVGAVDVAARLGGTSVTKESVSCPGSSSVGSVTGEGRSINTANEQIYLGNTLKKSGLRTALSNSDLPTLLASGSVTDSDAGTTYSYDQFIDFPTGIALSYQRLTGKTPNMVDPTYLFKLDTSASTTSSFYRARVVFNNEVNLSTVAGEKINLFGKTYTFSADSTETGGGKVVLLGSAITKTMGEGETATVTIDGAQYDVKLLSVGSATNVGVQIGADSKSINKGSTATVGGVDVYVDDIFFSSKTGTVSSASLFIGARKLILQDSTNVKTKIGSDSEKVVDGTFTKLTLGSTNKLTTIDVYTNAQSSNADFLTVGGKFQDTVWKSFNVQFPSVSTPVLSDLRDKVEVLPSGTKDATVSFTTDRGYKNTVKFAHLTSATPNALQLADQDGDKIVVAENQSIDKNEYFVLDSGDFSRMFEITSASSLGTSDASLTIRDVFSGATTDVRLGATNATAKVIDGQTYYFNATSAVSTTDLNVRITWGTSASLADTGTYVTVFPTLLTKNRARLALTNQTQLVGLKTGQTLQFPTGAVNLSLPNNDTANTITPATTERGDSTVLKNAAGSSVSSLVIGNTTTQNSTIFGLGKTSGGVRWYSIDASATNGTLTVRAMKGKSNAVAGQTNSSTPGILLVEAQDDNSDVNTVLVDIGQDTSSGDNRTNANSADFSSSDQGTNTLTRDSNTDISFNTDFWGTVSWRDTGDQDKVTLWYPQDQVSAQVYVLAEGATIGGSSSTGGTTVDKWTVNPIKTSLAKLDSEVTSADKATKNLILVGGPCVNTLVADLNTAGKFPYSCKSWPARNFGLLQVVDDAFASGKVALVVGGTRAADTRMATSKLQMYDTASLSGTSKEVVA